MDKNLEIMDALYNVYRMLKISKPNNRSNWDRCYAVTITEMEKIIAYFNMFVLETKEENVK